MRALLLLILVGVCQAENPWISRPSSNNTYQFNNDEYGWMFARENCLAQNGDLVSINDAEELNWIRDHYPMPKLVGMRDRYVLIGLLDEPPGSGYKKWVDGKPFSSTLISWKVGEPLAGSPVERCAAYELVKNELWDVNCDVRVLPPVLTRYVCERDPNSQKGAVAIGSTGDPMSWLIFLKAIGKINELKITAAQGFNTNLFDGDTAAGLDIKGLGHHPGKTEDSTSSRPFDTLYYSGYSRSTGASIVNHFDLLALVVFAVVASKSF